MIIASIAENLWGDSQIVFTIPLPNKDPVFMSTKISDYGLENSGLVVVDAQKFLRLWRAHPKRLHEKLANGNLETWPRDDNFSFAVDGFAEGPKNPVPLAEVRYENDEAEFVTFINGITRTIWLLTHGCVAFPVKCSASFAGELFASAAADGASFHLLRDWAELTPAS
jgi:hypothetical protein